jgi:hypothetical protein
MPVARCNACSRLATERTVSKDTDGRDACFCGCRVFYPSWRTFPEWVGCKIGLVKAIEPDEVREGELGGSTNYLNALYAGGVP